MLTDAGQEYLHTVIMNLILIRCHEDQEGFYVLEGEGYAKLDDLEFPIKAGDSFIALPGVRHTLKTKEGCQPVKVFWFHSAV